MTTKSLERLQAAIGLSVALVCWAAAAQLDSQPVAVQRAERVSEFDAAFMVANASRPGTDQPVVFASL